MSPPTCGIWLAPRRLVAVILGPSGEVRPALRAALTGDARLGLVQYLAAQDCEVVLPEVLVAGDAIAAIALRQGIQLWAAPDPLLSALRRAGAITDPVRSAALLARLPRIPLLRAQLRRLTTSAAHRQIPLL